MLSRVCLPSPINTEKLWDNVVVLGVDNREVWHAQPVPNGSPASNQGPHHPLPTDFPVDLLPPTHPTGRLPGR